MNAVWIAPLSVLSTSTHAGEVITGRVPEPGMWALIGMAAAAFGVARFIRRK
ncbi:MAG: PEP-CTERM sorting domain-containing protein [Burkholderiales bacterium]